ncbi:MAG: hypothetical protein QXT53_02495 [Ignisphaera sp.]
MTQIVADVVAQIVNSLEADGLAIDLLTYRKIIEKHRGRRVHSYEILNEIANNIIIGKAKLCRESNAGRVIGFYKGITIARTSRSSHFFSLVVKDAKSYCHGDDITDYFLNRFVEIYPRRPIILFDALFWELHHEYEKKKALKQLLMSVNIIRQYLTDLNVLLIFPPHEIMVLLNSFKNAIKVLNEFPHDLLKSRKAIVLDPYAPDKLTEDDVMNSDVFLIGLLVDDMFPRPFATYGASVIGELDAERKSIAYKGSVVGVPKEINKIIEIILSVRFANKTIEDAIIDAMGIDDKIYRVVYEASKICKRDEALEDVVKRLMREFQLDERYYRRILARVDKVSCRGM